MKVRKNCEPRLLCSISCLLLQSLCSGRVSVNKQASKQSWEFTVAYSLLGFLVCMLTLTRPGHNDWSSKPEMLHDKWGSTRASQPVTERLVLV